MGLDKLIIQAGLFNQQSTDSDRREKLEHLLKNNAYQDELDDDIPDDLNINEMLARNGVISLIRMNLKYLTKWTKVATKKNNIFIRISKCKTMNNQYFLTIASRNQMKFQII